MITNDTHTPIVVWEKWADPMGFDDDEIDAINYGDNFETDQDQPVIKTKHIKMIVTPMGMIPYNENTASSSIFNFWVGHCNFDITQDICSLLESSVGVETLDIFTRYRFRIGIGKVFDDGQVMRDINRSIKKYFNNYE